uniref:Uncharacterized protein n=1 Tax=Neospora caninum (strain Liverpool) TaxID=572307 RepID=A0A0F7UIU3_NEOCL|nr:TPA: hypothetical protein BN1204_042595 [Neospora caninum Liverpool]
MSCVIELFPFVRRANAVAFIPSNQARAPPVGQLGSETDEVPKDFVNEFASLTLTKSGHAILPAERSNGCLEKPATNPGEPSHDSLSDGKRPHVYLREIPCTGGHTFGLYVHPNEFARAVDGACSIKTQDEQGASALNKEDPRQAIQQPDHSPVRSSIDREEADGCVTRFVFQLPTTISSFRVISFSELGGGYGACQGFYLKLSLTLAVRLCPLTMIPDQNEVKLLRSVKPFRLQCKSCKEIMATLSSPDVLALPSTLWTEMSETVACEECSPVPVTKADFLAKPNRICVGTDHIALSPLDIDEVAVRINGDKLLCNSCGTMVGYPTRSSAFCGGQSKDENHLHCGRQQVVGDAESSGTSCHSCRLQGPAGSCDLAEACFLKHRVYVQQLCPDIAPSDILWRHTEACAIAKSIERICKKASIHRFLVERGGDDEDKADNTGSCSASALVNKIASVELTIVVREFFPLVVQKKEQPNEPAESETFRSPPVQRFHRAMKVLFRAVASTQTSKADSRSHRLQLPRIPFEDLLDELQRNARLYESSPVEISSFPTKQTVSYLPLPPVSPL